MRIKTREAFHKTIKTVEGMRTVGERTSSGAGELNRQAAETQNADSSSENEYAGEKIQDSSATVARDTVLASDWIGRRGIKRTTANIKKLRSRPIKKKLPAQRQLLPPAKQALQAPKKTMKAAEQTAKASAKAAKKASATVKKVAQGTVKAVKVAVKAIVQTVKVTVAVIKNVIAAIAAGGWVAVVVVLLLCIVGLVVGSVRQVFIRQDGFTGLTVEQVLNDAELDFRGAIEEQKEQYTYDVCYMGGALCDRRLVLATFITMENLMESDRPFDDEEIESLKSLYGEMTSLEFLLEEGETVSLYVTLVPIPADEVPDKYGFSEKQTQSFWLLLSSDFDEVWALKE